MAARSAKRPNILLLYSDQHNARVLGCYGNGQVRTPHLDALASRGVRCDNAFTQNPICTPSRMCIMSGQYVHNFGTYSLMGPSPDGLPSLFSHVRRQGYRTGMAGKTHTPTGWLARHCDDVGDGYGYEQHLTPETADRQFGLQGLTPDDYDRYLEELGLADQRDDKILPGQFEKAGHRWSQGVDACAGRLPKEHTIEGWAAMRCERFIEDAARDGQPFCYWMTVPHPHEAYAPAREFWDLYDEATLELPPNADNRLEGRHPAAVAKQRSQQGDDWWRLFDPKDWESARRRVLRGYYGCVSQVDYAVGRVMAKLDELGLRDNTIVVYTTDHGEFAGEHGLIEKAPGIGFGCVTRIPMIWSWPGRLPEGTVRDELVESIDFLPTVCRLAGLDEPDWVDGLNIADLLARGGEVREVAVTENPLTKTIHTRRWKLTQYLPETQGGRDFGELFDRQNDPWELRNLYFDPEYREVVGELRFRLYQWLVRTTRNVSINPVAPGPAGDPTPRSWDLAGDLRDGDGKVGRRVTRRLIDEQGVNYL
ncbi:MAG: sulfatase-like hydrolase/transferase [Planctomycetes bacterium]|nr:sulfatase-like hydrolase/transferase [Planctomycetota bacterium]